MFIWTVGGILILVTIVVDVLYKVTGALLEKVQERNRKNSKKS